VAEKQEILRSSELSEFSTARTNLKPEQTTGTNTGECLRCRQVLVTAPGVHPAKGAAYAEEIKLPAENGERARDRTA